MYNLLISIGAGLAIGALVRVLGFSWLAAIIPTVIGLLGTFVVLARRVAKKVQDISLAAQKELSVQVTNQRDQQARIEKAIKLLESALVYDRWQFLVGAQIHAQIGMIKYMTKNVDGAKPHLAKANPRDYMAMAIQAAIAFKKKDAVTMERYFEVAVKYGKKEALMWAAYAWCLLQNKEKEKALKVMARAVESNPSDERLKAGLQALQNDKKLKMKPYEPLWWQLGLEQPPIPTMGNRRVQFR